jgi:hypothetical protein
MEAEETNGETVQPGQGGDAAELDKGKAAAEGSEADGGEEGAEDAELKGKLSPEAQAKLDRRIGKLTAKAKGAAEERDQLKARLAEIEAEKQRTADAEVAHLGVAPEYFEAEDLKTVKAAEADIAEADAAEKAWASYAATEDGYTDKTTKQTFTPAQCAKFAAQAARQAGAAEARKQVVVDRARAKMLADLRETRARKAGPKPDAGASRVPAAPKTIAKQPGEGAGGGSTPARPADIAGGGAAANVPKNQAEAKAWLNSDE